jgi:hypothetical protein
MRKISTLIAFLLVFSSLHAGHYGKKYDLAVAAIFKNEAPYFKEWLEYHQLVGVEHFYLYNNGSTDDYAQVLEPYIRSGVVTLIDWPDNNPQGWENKAYKWVYCTQVTAYENCIKGLAKDEATWLAMIDIDEFMVPAQKATMTEVLDDHSGYASISVLWQVYGTSNIYELPPNALLIESLFMTSLPNHPLNKGCPKMIIKPEFYNKFEWPPHHCSMTIPRQIQVGKDVAQINHYLNRTVSFFMDHKIKSKEHMNNRKMTDVEINEWLRVGNDIEDDNLTIFRYVPELRKRMGYSCI